MSAARRLDISTQAGRADDVPVFSMAQLPGRCLGLAPRGLGLERLMVPATRVLNQVRGNGDG